MIKKYIGVLGLICMMLMMGSTVLVFAERSTEQKLEDAREELEQLQADATEAKAKLDEVKKEKNELLKKLEELDSKLVDATVELERTQTKIRKKNEAIAEAETEIEKMNAEVDKQYEATKLRIQYLYENSNQSLLAALFQSNSFGEMLNRIEYYSNITNYDRDKLEELKQVLEEVNEKQSTLIERKTELELLMEEQQAQKEKIEVVIAETKQSLEQLNEAVSDASEDAEAYDERLEAALAYEEKLEAQKAAEDLARLEEIRRQEEELRRQREEERRRREEEERRRKEEEERKKQEALEQESGESTGDEAEETPSNEVVETPSGNYAWTQGELEMMAAIIQCESDGEPYEGKLAVGSVVMNRVASKYFPDDIAGVIYQNRQFSPVASGRFAEVLARGANDTCRRAALEVLNGNITVDYLFFRRDNGTIDGYVIGHHVFY